MKKILVIEDDLDIARLLRIHLEDLGHEVDHAATGDTGLDMALNGSYSLVVLDIMLPGIDGFDVCKRIRSQNQHLPILVLSARDDEVDKIVGLELGADAYMTKPFSVREFAARVKALFRRIEVDREGGAAGTQEEYSFRDLSLDVGSRRATLSGEPLELTGREFDLLLMFMQHPGRAFSRQELLESVWGYDYSGYSHTVNSHINRLRSKIEKDPSDPHYIQTVWGIGYRFADKPDGVGT
ncbi:MAG: response regulator transcription factor [Rhodothermales bacterium]